MLFLNIFYVKVIYIEEIIQQIENQKKSLNRRLQLICDYLSVRIAFYNLSNNLKNSYKCFFLLFSGVTLF